MMKNNIIIASFVLVFFMSLQFMYSQNKSDFDSILAAGTLEVYENPDKAIEIGTSVYENPSVDIKTKITSLMLISNGYVSKRDYQKSLEYIIEANKLSKQVNDLLIKINQILIVFWLQELLKYMRILIKLLKLGRQFMKTLQLILKLK